MHPVALAARELPDLFLLIGAAEVEQRAVGAAGDLAAAEVDLLLPAGNLLPHRVAGAERVARLVDITELDGLAEAQLAAVRRLVCGDHAEQRRLAGAVRANDADDAAGRQPEAQFLDQEMVAEALAQPVRLDHEVAEARPGRQHDLRGFRRLLAALRDQCLIGRDPRLALGLAGARALPDPFQFAFQGAAAGLLSL